MKITRLAAPECKAVGSRSGVTLFAGIERWGDEAGRSPLVRERGQRTQFSIGIGYGYRFRLQDGAG